MTSSESISPDATKLRYIEIEIIIKNIRLIMLTKLIYHNKIYDLSCL